MRELFIKLKNIDYLVWKDTDKAKVFYEGNRELDLLVKFDSKDIFEKIVLQNGYVKLRVNDRLRIKNIEHYIKFYRGKYYHLHVYFKLITGNHYVKEYCFDNCETLFENFKIVNDIKIIEEKAEFTLILIRLILKNTIFFKSIKISEKNRLKELSENIGKDEVEIVFEKLNLKMDLELGSMLSLAFGNDIQVKEKRKVYKQFKKYRRVSVKSFPFQYLKARINLLILRLSKESNKTLSNGGVSFAILGTDGSGKTSISSILYEQYRSKTSCKRIYLGGNSKTYSLMTRLYYFFYLFTRVFSPYKEKIYIAWYLYYHSLVLLELGKSKDRRKRVELGERLRSLGWVVIYERFPVIGLFDFPNHLMELKKHKWYNRKLSITINYLLNKIVNVVENLQQPDKSFLITVDFEKMKDRRELKPNEIIDIKKKLDTQSYFLETNEYNLLVVENNDNIETVIDFMNGEINEKLCMFNS